MRQRGRQSADVLTIAPNANFYSADAPAHLTAAQKEIWQQAVQRLGDDYFPAEVLPLLEHYCCTVVLCRFLQGQLGDSNVTGPERREVMNQYRAYTALMVQLATKLRITTQSTRRENKAKPKVNATPWQTSESEHH